ncbi:MAG: sigma-54-dependent Fis family transcriptional regulator, partial [Acidobacteriota bacterium]|nr:sigma-54-dependent Fis family transcriptional regulator [Acidobacteriota bacterium]
SRALRQGQRLAAENRLLRSEGVPPMTAESESMRQVLGIIHRVAPSVASVLISGEHGSGKEVVARTLHALSSRSGRPMVTVNAGSIPEGLFESELFGHVKGAFTGAQSERVGHFELASGSTLFLDEIANAPPAQQAKLLRVIESREVQRVGSSRVIPVDVRLISATNADLKKEVAAGRFREDLLFRLNTIEIHLPPLRERTEDVMPLAREFLSHFAARYRMDVSRFAHAAEQALLGYSWPGNVRELNHVIERAVLMAQAREVEAADLGLSAESEDRAPLEELPLNQVESLLIRKSLERFGGNISQAAGALGLSRSALYRRLERYGIKSNEG